MIVMVHYASVGIKHVGESDIALTTAWLSGSIANRWFLCFVSPGGIVGDILFFMLTGYFLCNVSNDFETKALKKVKPLVRQVVFYCCCFILIGLIMTIQKDRGGVSIIKASIFPVGRRIWWFFDAYIVLFLGAGALNRIFAGMNKRAFTKACISFFIVYFIIAAILNAHWFDLEMAVMGFMLGYYVRRFIEPCSVEKIQQQRILWIFLAIFMWLAGVIIMVFSMQVEKGFLPFNSGKYFNQIIDGMRYVFGTASAFCLFMVATLIKPFYSKFINTLAGCVFGVYIIHAGPLQNYIWKCVRAEKAFNYVWFPLLAVCSVVGIFAVCTLIDYIRKLIFTNLIDRNKR